MNMFKKSLLAVSVAGLATAAVAGTIGGSTGERFSVEGTAVLGTIGIGSTDELQVNLTTGRNYIENDILIFSVSGLEINEDSAPVVTASASGDTGVVAASSIALSYIKTEGSDILFRVENEEGIPAGSVLDLNGVDLNVDDATSGSAVSVSSRVDAFNEVVGIYDESKANTAATFHAQYALIASNNLTDQIATAESRYEFVGGTSTSAKLTFADDYVGKDSSGANVFQTLQNSYVADTVTHTIGSSSALSYLIAFDANEDGELSAAELNSAFSFSSTTGGNDDDFTVTMSDDMTTLTIEQEVSGAVDLDPTITFFAPGAVDAPVVIDETSFTAGVLFEGTASGVAVSTQAVAEGTGLGSWTLDGANVFVPYMPYGNGISQVIYVTNDSSQTGDVEVTAYDEEGNEFGPWVVAESKGKTITKLTTEINQRLFDAGFTSGKVAFDIVVNAPSDDIKVTTSYNVRGNRVQTGNYSN